MIHNEMWSVLKETPQRNSKNHKTATVLQGVLKEKPVLKEMQNQHKRCIKKKKDKRCACLTDMSVPRGSSVC